MSTTKFEHVIGRDGLHRIRLTAENNEIFDASHQGFDSRDGAVNNEMINLVRRLEASGLLESVSGTLGSEYWLFLQSIPTVDERVQDPLEPQTQTQTPEN